VGFDPKSPCRKLWEDLWEDGKLSNKVGKFLMVYQTVVFYNPVGKIATKTV